MRARVCVSLVVVLAMASIRGFSADTVYKMSHNLRRDIPTPLFKAPRLSLIRWPRLRLRTICRRR